MEYSLRLPQYVENGIIAPVLILILMEYSLRLRNEVLGRSDFNMS